jgi:hypothetical protein
VGVKLLALGAVVALLAGPAAGSARYVESRQVESGAFAEAGGRADAALTAWAALGLVAAGGSPDALAGARAYLAGAESELRSQTDLALHVLARSALGDRPAALVERLEAAPAGRLVNATAWTIVALRQAGRPAPPALVRALLRAQRPNGGWGWVAGGSPDSNDTSAAVQALRAAGVRGRPIDRAVAFLLGLQAREGGFALVRGRAPDAQSTAWAVQALLAAGRKPGAPAWRFLSRLRRPDGSYRYSARYATTPVWVTSQVLPALAGKPFPLR